MKTFINKFQTAPVQEEKVDKVVHSIAVWKDKWMTWKKTTVVAAATAIVLAISSFKWNVALL